MIKFIALAFALVAASVAARAAAPDSAVTAPIHQFVDSLNHGDAKKAAEAHMPNAPIIDEFPPHRWSSFDRWFEDFAADAKKNGVSDVHVTLGSPTTSTVGAAEAYEVVPNVITAKHNGKKAAERGIFTFALSKTASGWRIASWAWAKQ
jgi:hypothetical protein